MKRNIYRLIKGEKMSIKAVLFDLDGTLLPMDMDIFTNAYFKGICKKVEPLGYEPEKLVKSIWKGTGAMIKNSGKSSNEAVFWETFKTIYPNMKQEDMDAFDEFYRDDFDNIKEVCGFTGKASALIKHLRKKGLKICLATNPIFPATATEARIRWAGLEPQDFEFYTTYENSSFSKPNPQYFKEVAQKLNVMPQECLMVGNDVSDDLPAEKIGMKVFLLTDCLINKENVDISCYPNGSFEQLIEYIEKQ